VTIVYVGLGCEPRLNVYDYNELHSTTITIVVAIGVDMQNGSWLTGSVSRGRDGVCMYGGFMLCARRCDPRLNAYGVNDIYGITTTITFLIMVCPIIGRS
jgi:hypothetical protein